MGTEDLNCLPDSDNSGSHSENEEPSKRESRSGEEEGGIDGDNLRPNFGTGQCSKGSESEVNGENIKTGVCLTLPENLGDNLVDSEAEEGEVDGDSLGLKQGDIGNEDTQFSMETEVDMDLVDSPIRQMKIELAETVEVSGNFSGMGFALNAQNGSLETPKESLIQNSLSNGGSVSGVKRARITSEELPSVHVTYKSLTRGSKRKLVELLQQWSEWHVQHGSSSQDSNEVLESGEDTYFPALRIGTEKSSAVSFWIENQTKKQRIEDFIPSDGDAVPLYDRGFSLGLTSADGPNNAEGGLEIVNEASRCFNCGSYSHSLKECPKPRDNAAVNNARKQHKSKKNQSAGSRNAARYYQSSSGGKYDGLKPGSLHAETRQLLGLGELDPPPWLNRMRELGYPPGYIDPDDEDEPSGITIFADGEDKVEQEDGEIAGADNPDPPRKKTVDFPGLNAPIPENADERVWEIVPSSYAAPSRNQPQRRSNRPSESGGRWHHHEQRGSVDEGPPGVDPVFSASSYPPRFGNYGFDNPRGSMSSSLSRSHSERGRSPLVYEDFTSHSRPNENDERWKGSRLDDSYRSNDGRYDYDRRHQRSWR